MEEERSILDAEPVPLIEWESKFSRVYAYIYIGFLADSQLIGVEEKKRHGKLLLTVFRCSVSNVSTINSIDIRDLIHRENSLRVQPRLAFHSIPILGK